MSRQRKRLSLVEDNYDRQHRDIILKWRPLPKQENEPGLAGVVKSLIAHINVIGHWAIQIGSYTHELIADLEDDTVSHFRGRWVQQDVVHDRARPQPQFERHVCGTTTLTDRDINSRARQIVDQMKITVDPDQPCEYNSLYNSCQRFCKKLAADVSETSLKTKASCIAFFARHGPSAELIGVYTQTAMTLFYLHGRIKDAREGDETPQSARFKAAVSLACLDEALRAVEPLAKRLYHEHDYIRKNGDASYEIFDRKSRSRMHAEIAFERLMRCRGILTDGQRGFFEAFFMLPEMATTRSKWELFLMPLGAVDRSENTATTLLLDLMSRVRHSHTTRNLQRSWSHELPRVRY